MIKHACVALLVAVLAVSAFDVPCSEKLIGGTCDFDEQCFGTTSVCRDGRCSCAEGFDTATFKDGRVCRPAPSTVGASCSSACQAPLLCVSGKCACDGGTVVRGKCTGVCKSAAEEVIGTSCRKVARISASCSSDAECRDPFSYCDRSKRCSCVPGTKAKIGLVDGRRQRVCEPTCPDGSAPGKSCRQLYVNDVDMLLHVADTDTCPGTQFCATYGKELGHCCPLSCPMGTLAARMSCDASPNSATPCDLNTHYCHTVGNSGGAKRVCCPKPCSEPYPIFYEGKCHAAAHRGDMCDFDQQCEGGATMRCLRQICQCRPGYVNALGTKYPSCMKSCAGQALVGDQCLGQVALGERCLADAQCQLNARCFSGKCECDCGFALEQVLGKETCAVPGTSAATSDFLTKAVESLFKGKTGTAGIQSLLGGSG